MKIFIFAQGYTRKCLQIKLQTVLRLQMTDMNIVGNTVFGAGLQEADATSDYDAITADVDSTRIDKS